MHENPLGEATFLVNLMFRRLDKFDEPTLRWRWGWVRYVRGTYIRDYNWVKYSRSIYSKGVGGGGGYIRGAY